MTKIHLLLWSSGFTLFLFLGVFFLIFLFVLFSSVAGVPDVEINAECILSIVEYVGVFLFFSSLLPEKYSLAEKFERYISEGSNFLPCFGLVLPFYYLNREVIPSDDFKIYSEVWLFCGSFIFWWVKYSKKFWWQIGWRTMLLILTAWMLTNAPEFFPL